MVLPFRDEQQQLLRRLKGYLNKLTLEKFDKLYAQILGAGIKEKEEVNALMKMVFEKAVSQHHFIQVNDLSGVQSTQDTDCGAWAKGHEC